MRTRVVALGVAAAVTYALAATLAATALNDARGAVALTLAAAALTWTLAPRAGHATLAAILAVDLAVGFTFAYRAPWLSPAWAIPRYVALALVSRGRPAPSASSLAAAIVVVALASLYAFELVRVLRSARGDPPRPVETAIVLGFGLREGGRVPPVFEARIARAVALRRAGLARHLLFTGGVGAHPPAESVAARARAIALGVPAEAVLIEARSHTTRENMIEARRVLAARGLARAPAAVVSDTFHLARARRYARDAGIDPVMVAAITPAWTHRGRAAWWVLREAALLVVDDLLRVVRA